MIRSANPAIDVADLEMRVRALAATAGAIPMQVADHAADPGLAQQMRYVRELLDDIGMRLALSAERSAPRTELPPRLARLGPAGSVLMRAMNYAFKSQRESDDQLRAAVRGVTAAVAALADLVEGQR